MGRVLSQGKIAKSCIYGVLTLVCCIAINSNGYAAKETMGGFVFHSHSDYWPTNGWKHTSPEEQGMSSSPLAAMFKEINDGNYYISSVMVIRNGYVVAEANRNPLDHMLPIWSSTKSITSALIGIALEQEKIRSIEQAVFEFFPHMVKQVEGTHLKKKLTVKHLLSMSSGLDWPEVEISLADDRNPEYQMEMSTNWAEYVLDRPMSEPPGTTFNYNSGCSIVLTSILGKVVGDVEDFAFANLFFPLGIKRDKYLWNKTTDGLPNGSHGLVMRPGDMAKIGYLYLKGGNWENRQIVPRNWIEQSTKSQTKMTWKGMIADVYGYGWYVQSFGFHSMGYQGQYIFVLPEAEIVVVFTSELALHEIELPIHWIEEYILPAIVDRGDIAVINGNQKILQAEIQRFNENPYW